MDQVLVIAAACMLILGPQKTLAAAYWLGGHMGKLKKLLDECKRELSLKDLSGIDLKSDLGADLKELHADARRVSAQLHDAMRMDPPAGTAHEPREPHPAKEASAQRTKDQSGVPNKLEKAGAELKTGSDTSGSQAALTARIAALETELAAIKVLLEQRTEEHVETYPDMLTAEHLKKELRA